MNGGRKERGPGLEQAGRGGIQHAIFDMPDVQDIEPLETFGREIIPAVADL